MELSEEDIQYTANILQRLVGPNEEKLTLIQTTKLLNLWLEDDTLMFGLQDKIVTTDNLTIQRFILEMTNQIFQYGFDEIYEYLKSQNWKLRKDIILNSPSLSHVRDLVKTNIDNLYYEQAMESSFPCPKCGSLETNASTKQTRSGDEGYTTTIYCQVCVTYYSIRN